MNDLRLTLPVLPRLAKWLRAHYPMGLRPAPHDPRLAQVWAVLQAPPSGEWARSNTKQAVPLVTLHAHVGQFHPRRRSGTSLTLTPIEIRTTNVLLDALLYGEFAQLARQIGSVGGSAGQAAREFCDRYDFSEDELSEDTLKRVWNRQQNRGNSGSRVGFEDSIIAALLC